MKLQDVTVIGHSLGKNAFFLFLLDRFYDIFCFFVGAHIAGRAAKMLKSPGKIAVIIGLDPASVGYDFYELSKRLTDNDADYVQVIHTDGDKFGFGSPLGHGTYTLSLYLLYYLKTYYLLLTFS